MHRFAIVPAFISILALSSNAQALTIAGFTFDSGELAFADDALVVSGTVTGASDETVRNTLVGSDTSDSIRVITPDVAVIEIVFSDYRHADGAFYPFRHVLTFNGEEMVTVTVQSLQVNPDLPDSLFETSSAE